MAHQFFFNPFILDNLPTPNVGFDVVQDISEPRLRMYITSRGVKTFFVRKRVRGRDKRIIIGNYPDVDIDTARASVSKVLNAALADINIPHKKIKLSKFIDIYIEKRICNNISYRNKLKRAINRHLSVLMNEDIGSISSEQVSNVISSIKGPAIAARMQDFLKGVFRYAADLGYVNKNPINSLQKIKQHPRKRPINKSVVQRLISVIDKEKDANLRAAFFMLIYGFATKSHIFAMQWRDLDFNHYTWCGRPLSDMAVVILQDLPQNSRWVFPGRGPGHLTDPRTAWRHIVTSAGIPNLTMDDVNKFLMRKLVWASDKEGFRINMNSVLSDIIA